MPQDTRPEAASGQPVHWAAIALRSAGQLYEINASAARAVLQAQARAAAAFGLPDWSPLWDSADERLRGLFSASTDRLLDTARLANEAVGELQHHVGRVLQTQASQAAESWQQGLDQLGNQARDGFDQLRDTARRTADDAQRSSQALGEQFRENARRAGEEARSQQGQADGAAREGSAAIAGAVRELVQQQPLAQQPGAVEGARPSGESRRSGKTAG